MATLLIAEPHCSGHRMQYVRRIAQGALSQGHEVRLATLEYCLDHPLYVAMQRGCSGRVKVDVLPNENVRLEKWIETHRTADLVRREFAYHSLFSNYYRSMPGNERPDFVLVPYLDYCVHAAGLVGSPFGDTPWAGIVMRTSFHFESFGIRGPKSRLHSVKKRLFLRTLGNKHLRKLLTIDETLVAYVRCEKPEMSRKIGFVPDPAGLHGTCSRAQARRQLGISEDAVIVLVYGTLSLRKGVDALLDAAQRTEFPNRVQILLAGKQDEQVRRLLISPEATHLRKEGRLHEYNRFLSDEEEHAVFRAADIVWLGYRGHYTMSGVLVQAGMMGLPVVACSEGVVGWLTRRHRLGLSVEVSDLGAVIGAVAALLRSPETTRTYAANGKRFAASHTPESFSVMLKSHLRKAV